MEVKIKYIFYIFNIFIQLCYKGWVFLLNCKVIISNVNLYADHTYEILHGF